MMVAFVVKNSHTHTHIYISLLSLLFLAVLQTSHSLNFLLFYFCKKHS